MIAGEVGDFLMKFMCCTGLVLENSLGGIWEEFLKYTRFEVGDSL